MPNPSDHDASLHDVLHDNEIPIDAVLVRDLVDSQFPQYSEFPLAPLGASGSTNKLFRLGENLLVRMPRQPDAGLVIEKEHAWLPTMQKLLPVQVPEFVEVGKPDIAYPEQWSIVRWMKGDLPLPYMPDMLPTEQRSTLAVDLANTILALRAAELPRDIGPNLRGYRGRSLARFDRAMRYCLDDCRKIKDLDLDLDKSLQIWEAALALPGATEPQPDCWYHGDLVCENILLQEGKLSGVLDFGGLSIGDPTIELHGAWEIFDKPARDVFRQQMGVDDAEWQRGRAWALGIAVGAFSYYWNKMPGRVRSRLTMAQNVLAEYP